MSIGNLEVEMTQMPKHCLDLLRHGKDNRTGQTHLKVCVLSVRSYVRGQVQDMSVICPMSDQTKNQAGNGVQYAEGLNP